jgi:putative SOS response-associated peptidase YedK
MCGRLTLTVSAKTIADCLGLAEVPTLTPRYNIAPTQQDAVVARAESGRRLGWARWGLIPAWASDPGSVAYRRINARAKTVEKSAPFRAAFRQRRCLIPADGFFEWQTTSGKRKKQPYHFALRGRRPFGIAGLWERWRGGSEDIVSCALLTTSANAVVGPVHDRMPVILPPAAFDRWLAPGTQDSAELGALLRPYPSEEMLATRVGFAVNNPRVDAPACVEPLAMPARD